MKEVAVIQYLTVNEELTFLLKKVLDILYPEIDVPIIITPAKKEEFGDLATNVAMILAKQLKQNPLEIAKTIVKKLNSSIIKKVEVAPPGFINIFLSAKFYVKHLESILSDQYFSLPGSDDKIILEFVSANPTGPLNAVSARAAAVGDSLGNILKYTGSTVYKEYYANDAGNQVRLLGESLLIRYEQNQGKDVVLEEDHYQGKYLIDLAKEMESVSSDFANMSREKQIEYCSNFGVNYLLKTQQKDLEEFRVLFDNYFRESELHKNNKLDEVFQMLKDKQVVFEDEGKQWFRSTQFGDEKDRVLIRDDGRPTYFLADIAYHYSKIKRGYNKIINLWGPDHHGYISRLSGALQALGFKKENFEVILVQQVNLIENGEKVKMSKRAGKLILMKDIITEVGIDVTRYFLLMRNTNSLLDFDLELAKKQTDENPVFYIQYAFARIHSIFRMAETKNIQINKNTDIDWKNETLLPLEKNTIKKMLEFNTIVLESARKRDPSGVAHFLYELASVFHRFYNDVSVLKEEDSVLLNNRLLLLSALIKIFQEGLNILGISAPEKM